MNSEPAGKMEVGQIIVVSERKELDGTVRVRFNGGWASVTSKSGKVLLEEVVDSQPTAAVAAAAAAVAGAAHFLLSMMRSTFVVQYVFGRFAQTLRAHR